MCEANSLIRVLVRGARGEFKPEHFSDSDSAVLRDSVSDSVRQRSLKSYFKHSWRV